ncbi:hypothetical protein C362_02767 [Cryptococcus neoformans Bt1]|nr:hypothetical protein C362_02767 [Cryptococcus neoformans var. grubii Bt1]
MSFPRTEMGVYGCIRAWRCEWVRTLVLTPSRIRHHQVTIQTRTLTSHYDVHCS